MFMRRESAALVPSRGSRAPAAARIGLLRALAPRTLPLSRLLRTHRALTSPSTANAAAVAPAAARIGLLRALVPRTLPLSRLLRHASGSYEPLHRERCRCRACCGTHRALTSPCV